MLYLGCLFFLPFLTIAQSSPQFLSQVGQVDSLYSNTLQETRTIYVQLPESYDPTRKQKYPVAYILDGEVFLPTLSNVHQFYSGGFMPEMVLVGISNSEHRTRDLTTSEIKMKYGFPFNEPNGQAESFFTFLQNELIPYVESKYPVTNYRSLIGHSYGGLFTIFALVHHPEVFANYLAIDPSLDWDDQKLLKQAEAKLPTQDYLYKSVYVSMSGQLHPQNPKVTIDNVMKDSSEFTLFARSILRFRELAENNSENALNFHWQFYPTEIHGTIPLPSIGDGMQALFSWFQMENTDRFNSPDTPNKELASIIRYRANKLALFFGYPVPPYPEDLLNVLGLMSWDMEQKEKSKMFFEFALEYYPRSAAAHAAMADFYERSEDKVQALKYATQAYELSGSEDHKRRMEALSNK